MMAGHFSLIRIGQLRIDATIRSFWSMATKHNSRIGFTPSRSR